MNPVPDNKPKHQLPPYPGHPHPMHRMPHPESPHGLPPAHGAFVDRDWRHLESPSSYDAHHPPNSLPHSNAPRPLPIPAPGHPYATGPSRDFHLPPPKTQPPDGVYHARPTSLPSLAQPGDYRAGTHSIPPINGAPHDATPQSAPPEYPRMHYSSPDQLTNGEPPPYSAPYLPHPPSAAYDATYYANQSMGVRQRKVARAQQACDQCRARKAKCDEGRPACSHCRENSLTCVYKESPPHRQEKSTQAVLDRLDQQQAFFDRLDTKLDHNDSELMKIMKKVRDQTNDQHDKFMRILTELGLNVEKIASGPSKVKTKGKGRPTQAQGDNRPMKSEEGGMAPENSPDPAASYSEEEKTVDDCHSIPVEHSTAAHKLLAWRWIKYLVDRDGHDEDYVMKLEENRGLIRVYGWGEGHDASEGPGPDPFYSEDGGYPHSASPRTPSAPPDYSTCEMLPGSGFLITDPATVRRFRTSYLEHMHKLHPFLDFRELDKKISAFTQAYCPQRSSASPITIGSNAGDLPRGAKRKRSDTQHSHGPRRVERTVENAIILLVLAVGSICEFRNEPLPSLSYPQWATDSSLATSQTPGHTFSPVDGQASFTSMTSVRSGPEPRRQRNMDVMPGLAYYAYATDILGNLQGSTRLPYAQAALLAGIYVGQLAHPFQSHAWITQAARTCQVLLRPKHYEKLQDGPVKDLYLFLFWTCFQLESDLLAELDLPDSGISRMDPQIGLPTGQFTMDVPDQPGEIFGANYMTMILYSAQITLRKILNRTHTDLYRVAKKQKHKLPAEKKDVHSILSLTLEQWRACLPNELRWKDDDPPAEDINVARLRAKYYGARYIIHRPVLYHYLEMFPPPGKQDPWSSPADSQSNRKTFSVGANETPFSQMPLDNQKACKTCVESAISSTKAFDGVKGGRPVVTNIFGTAHAQFGNMLVLSATYMSPFSELISGSELKMLLERTINFLEKSRNISPTLRRDAEILRNTYVKIFHAEPPSPGTSTAATSAT